LFVRARDRHLGGALVGGTHRWVFFDDGKMSETYGEQITRCPGCKKTLEHKELRAALA
jgi:hypothetical protein